MSQETNYDALLPLEESLVLGGNYVTIKTYKAGQVSYVLPRVRVLFDKLSTEQVTAEENQIDWLKQTVTAMFHNLEMIFGNEETFELMALSIDKDVEFVKGLEIEEARELFDAMFRVNFTYFFKLALPQAMNRALTGLDNIDHAEKVEVLKKLMK